MVKKTKLLFNDSHIYMHQSAGVKLKAPYQQSDNYYKTTYCCLFSRKQALLFALCLMASFPGTARFYTTDNHKQGSQGSFISGNICSYTQVTGCMPFFRNKFQGLFQDFSRIQIVFSRTPNFTFKPSIPKIYKSVLLAIQIHFV